jgi:hypothetical protein
MLALERRNRARVPDGPQSIVTRNQLFAAADERVPTVATSGDIFVTDGVTST